MASHFVINPPPAKGKITGAALEVAGGAFLFERLDVIDDPRPRSATFNMAADESLLNHLGEAAVLRIYRWRRPAVSYGYFAAYDTVQRISGARELVRRWTGGGIVEHGADFTYSLLVPRRELARLGAAAQSYAVIHRALARALETVGIAACPFLTGPSAGTRGPCFENPVAHDLMTAGRKSAGAAQRRTHLGLLHQGSVQCLETADWRDRLAASLPGSLCAAATERLFTAREEASAGRLAEAKYATVGWLKKF